MENVNKNEEILKKYDKEANTRNYNKKIDFVVTILLALFSLFAISSNIFLSINSTIKKAIFVAFLILFSFLLYPMFKSKKSKTINTLSIIVDIILIVIGAGAFIYFVVNYDGIAMSLFFGNISKLQMIIGIIGILCVFEACRRVSGLPIVVIAICFIIYSLIGGKVSLSALVTELFYNGGGVLGTPIDVCATYIVIFVIFGAFLETTGISQFFIDVANAIAGKFVGGPAKVAVISSALCGMVSGSSVANTVTTGSITIPMMKKTGYKGEFAGAVEAAASTGGQIMPPIMGAAAFLMIEFVPGYTYADIALRAILPAVLYFAGIFIMVHLEAKKLGLKGIDSKELPKLLPLLIKQGFLLLPLVVLVYLVTIHPNLMAIVAFYSILASIMVAGFTKNKNTLFIIIKLLVTLTVIIITAKLKITSYISMYVCLAGIIIFVILAHIEKNDKITFFSLIKTLANGGKNIISVGIACTIAGIIASCIAKTGIGNIVIMAIIRIAGGSKIIALFLTMLCCIVLGMGVPTTATYIIMATTCAPILTEMGIPAIAANMFVFYFGIVADITPPVALAAYAGSAIAKSNPLKTGINASKLAIGAYIIPYIFSLNPALLFIDTSYLEVLTIIITSLIGMFAISIALEGYANGKVNALFRIIATCGGLALIYPGLVTDLIGLSLFAIVVIKQYVFNKKTI